MLPIGSLHNILRHVCYNLTVFAIFQFYLNIILREHVDCRSFFSSRPGASTGINALEYPVAHNAPHAIAHENSHDLTMEWRWKFWHKRLMIKTVSLMIQAKDTKCFRYFKYLSYLGGLLCIHCPLLLFIGPRDLRLRVTLPFPM